MRKELLVAALLGLTAVTAPAHADGPHYRGRCRIAVVNTTTSGGVVAGSRMWNGEVNLVVMSTVPGSTVSAHCTLVIAGTEDSPLLSAEGVQSVAAAGRAQFEASATDTVAICTYVTINGADEPRECHDLTSSPVCPDAVCGAGGLLDLVFAVVQPVFDVITELSKVSDTTPCPILITLAPAVDSLPTTSVVYIDPVQGDTYVSGSAPGDMIWDCPPYAEREPSRTSLGEYRYA